MYNRLSFIAILTLLLAVEIQAEIINYTNYTMTSGHVQGNQEVFNEYLATVQAKSNLRENALPILLLHPATSSVHGTVMCSQVSVSSLPI